MNNLKKSLVALSTFAVMAIPVFAGAVSSGLSVGENVTPFHPQHVTGPNKGTDACPPCTYGNLPMVQVWVNGDDMNNVKSIAKTLNQRVVQTKNGAQLKGFVIVLVDKAKSTEVAKELEKIAKETGANDIALAWLDRTNSAVSNYKVNTDKSVKNTVFVYKNRQVATKFVNFEASRGGIANLNKAIDGIVK